MRIIVLHENPITAARFLADESLAEAVMDAATLLANCHRLEDGRPGQLLFPYSRALQRKPYQWTLPGESGNYSWMPLVANKDNIWSDWVRISSGNYTWFMFYYEALCREFALRFGHSHPFSEWVKRYQEFPRNLKEGQRTDFPLAVPYDYVTVTQYTDENGNDHPDLISSYRRWYVSIVKCAKWTKRTEPGWWSLEREFLKVMTTKTGQPTGLGGPTKL